jgi:uncharacterized protein (TIGR03067 family)
MRKPLLVLLALAVLTLGFAPAPFPRRDRSREDARKIEGVWVQFVPGQPVPVMGGTRLVIRPGRLTYNPETSPYAYALTIDTTKTPPTYDIKGIGGGAPGAVFAGIYRVEGDTLTLCYNSGSHNRPTAFDGPGKGTFIEHYKRVGR